MMAYTEHLKGAVVLTGLRGREQLKSDIGLSLYHRMRGMIASPSILFHLTKSISASTSPTHTIL
jgi:hypothetical protein